MMMIISILNIQRICNTIIMSIWLSLLLLKQQIADIFPHEEREKVAQENIFFNFLRQRIENYSVLQDVLSWM